MAYHDFAAFVKAKLKSLHDVSSQPCIYKAPDHLREVNDECYLPYVISIGPFHYGRPSLEAMQDCKWRCLQFILEHDSNANKLEHYLKIIRDLEGSIRECYTERVSLSSHMFNEMVLIDSAFIICLFMKSLPFLSSSSLLSHMTKRSFLKWDIKLKRDLFLEENQIPFFILERLFHESFGAVYPNTSFLDLACSFILDDGIPVVHGRVIPEITIARIKSGPKMVHLLDLLRNFCFPSSLRKQAVEPRNSIDFQFPSSASNLTAAGVKFVASTSTNMLDIKFSKGVLEIPPFQIWDVSESYFRSMILFEESHLPIKNNSYLVHYIVLLEKFIRTHEDVRILVQCGIIRNWIGSEETVARLFNGSLTKHIPVPVNFYYLGVCEDINAFANTRWNQWKAILKRDYFSHPWATISVIYALMLLILSLLQTIGTFTKK
ncbi:hypothetical protein vseg_014147 [Gypsophila vaccaria]